MSGFWGNNIKYSIYGESHGNGIGILIDGLPAGLDLDLDEIHNEMDRRRPGKSSTATSRNEGDNFDILSGYFKNKTTGAPLCILIKNTNTISGDYAEVKNVMRPGHADFTGFVKYDGFNDYRGGGHFSGRITAPLVFAGAVAKQILKAKNIFITAHISSIGNIKDDDFNPLEIQEENIEILKAMEIPTLRQGVAEEMTEEILKCRNDKDSIGGSVECAILNVPVGLGEPFFDSVESVLAHLLFSIPAVKGVEFGTGFKLATMKGSEANDEYYYDGDVVKTYTNNNGGILGGITNGMPVIFKTAIKPTASISKDQRSINILTKEAATLEVRGRHDPCIVPRAVPVIEAVAAMAILELLYNK
ncbi:MAG: chorismate synthase [Clostridiaceae bacterium]|nr:chorismate synthase [Clostridiaceae bacterium]